jgi:hypothetical protein
MGQFYFEQLLGTALQRIDGYNITATVLGVSGTILLLSFLYSVYQAFSMGGDVRMLAIGGVAYLILGLVFVNYGTDLSPSAFHPRLGVYSIHAGYPHTAG